MYLTSSQTKCLGCSNPKYDTFHFCLNLMSLKFIQQFSVHRGVLQLALAGNKN